MQGLDLVLTGRTVTGGAVTCAEPELDGCNEEKKEEDAIRRCK